MAKEKNTNHTIKKLFLASCFDEIKADKPGNVSINSPIIGLSYQKFFRAAEIAANIISNSDYSLGEIIFRSCHRCMNELNSNYNLGIILLCAPIVRVAIKRSGSKNLLRSNLEKEIKSIGKKDAQLIFNAIKLCKPAGLKNYNGEGSLSNDIKKINFKEIIKISSKWDRISRAYNDNYKEIFAIGLPLLRSLKKKFSTKFSTECLYLNYLSIDLDSHIQRKYGKDKAQSITNKSSQILKTILLKENSKSRDLINTFDNYLKKRNINPGTCADLTVTTLLIDKITDIVNFSDLKKN